MDGWYKVTLPASETGIGGKEAQLQSSFIAMFVANQSPKDAALFSDQDERLENHFFYFSPVAASIAKTVVDAFGGVRCSAPRLTNHMTLLVGHSDARDTLLKAS